MNKTILKYYILCFIVLLSTYGCVFYDYERVESKKIVGNIYIINLHLPEHPNYYPVFLEKSGYERHLIEEDEAVDYVKSSDSVMLIKTFPTPDVRYYIINHNLGSSIGNIQNVSSFEFSNFERSLNIKYHFSSEKSTQNFNN